MTVRAGRIIRGTDHPLSKLTEDDVRLILAAVDERERLRAEANRLSNKSLAQRICVSLRTVDRITQAKGWKHVQREEEPMTARKTVISPEDEQLILALLAEREKHARQVRLLSDSKIAKKFGVSSHAVRELARGRAWREF